MNSRRQKITSVIALFLVVALSEVYVHANLPDASANTISPAAAAVPFGRLTANYSGPSINTAITVNDVGVESGATIFTGSRISTPEGVGATVELGSLGHIVIAQNSNLTLNFTATSVEANLSSGYATLTTNFGVAGTLTTAEGAVEHTDMSKTSTVEASAGAAQGGGGGGNAGQAGGTAGNVNGSFHFGLLVWVSAVTLALVFIPCRGGHPGHVSPHTAGEDCHHHP